MIYERDGTAQIDVLEKMQMFCYNKKISKTHTHTHHVDRNLHRARHS